MSSAPHFTEAVLTTAYLPPVEYFFAIANSGRVRIEQHENYQKQSWRNRCRILSASGPEDLSIPVVKEERRSRPVRDIRIDYGEPWLQHHVRAFAAAYNASAFYDYYAGDLLPILHRKPVFLFDLNMALLEKLMDLLELDTPLALTDTFVKPGSTGHLDAPLRPIVIEEKNRAPELLASREQDIFIFDGRDRIQPKYKGKSLLAEYACEQAYYQIFINQDPLSAQDFLPNLSILDLLSAEGPGAGRFLRI